MPRRALSIVPLLLLCLLFTACSNGQGRLVSLGKTDIDLVTDIHQRQAEELLRTLAGKLYRRNPRELHKCSSADLDQRLAQLFNAERNLSFAELDNRQGVAAILLALEPDYPRDRVFALMVGLISMVRSAYGNQPEFFMFDQLEPQLLYNSARNIEILVWRLKVRVDDGGTPLLLTNSREGEEPNLSFERLFGKLISLQDSMALIAAQKWDRTINLVVRGTASMVFLPVGL
ncbi:MAG: hypothetical protein C0622_10515 [Desulfuromonas sp.]|nr:MAG: hypothetical protein C0622_10515 [Desulfuromonas sp.]